MLEQRADGAPLHVSALFGVALCATYFTYVTRRVGGITHTCGLNVLPHLVLGE